MLEVRQVSKRFGRTVALDRVSLNLAPGEVGAVVGPNGAGKSTLLGIVAGVFAPSAGQVRIAGMDAQTRAPQARRHVAFLPENCPLYNDLRVTEHLAYRGRLKGLTHRRLRARLRSVIEGCGIETIQNCLIGRLSAGQRQCVGLADVLLTEPHLMVLDEPFAALDPEQSERVCALLKNGSRHGAILIATHRVDLAENLCQRCTALCRGRVAGTLEVGGTEKPLAERLRSLWRTCDGDTEGEGTVYEQHHAHGLGT